MNLHSPLDYGRSEPTSVSPEQRFTKAHPCPVCRGWDNQPRGKSIRCHGFASVDGAFAFCARENAAGDLPANDAGLYKHVLGGVCGCGEAHVASSVVAVPIADDHFELPVVASTGVVTKRTPWRIPLPEGGYFEHIRLDYDDGSKSYAYALNGQSGLDGYRTANLPLSRWDSIADLADGAPIVVCEGEKSTDAAVSLGLFAVGTTCGAGVLPADAVLKVMSGHPVYLWPDNDVKGREHMNKIAESLRRLGVACFVINWPDAPPKGDAADFAEQGGDPAALLPGATQLYSGLVFRSAAEVVAEGRLQFQWVARPIVALGMVTLLHGEQKLAGKTTLVMQIVHTVVGGDSFLAQTTLKTNVVILTEESAASFTFSLSRAGLEEIDGLRILTWDRAVGVPFEDAILAARAECRRVGAKVLIVDTLSEWMRLRGEEDFRQGDVRQSFEPVRRAAVEDGLAVVLVHHDRKSGGDSVNSAAGSFSFTATPDIIAGLSRVPRSPITMRRVQIEGRPGVNDLLIDLTPDGFVVVDWAGVHVAQDEALLALLPATEATAVSVPELQAANPELKTTATRQALDRLVKGGRARTRGEGSRTSPGRFWRPEPGSGDDAALGNEPAAASNVGENPGE